MDKIICPICNKQFKTLNSHLVFKHKIKPEEFQKQYPDTPLVSESLKNKVSETCKKNGCGKWRKGAKLTEEQKLKMSERFSGENNPFYGKKHSEKTKIRMSENHADFIGDKNPFKNWIKNEENYNQWHESILNSWEDKRNNKEEYQELCELRSELTSKAYIEGKLKPYGHHHKWGHFKSKKFKTEFYYQSSYELKFLEFCETSDLIKTLDKNKRRIKYKVNNLIKNYIPDFLVNDKILVEIKPKTMLAYLNNKIKIRAGKKYCKDNGLVFKLLTEEELNNLEHEFL